MAPTMSTVEVDMNDPANLSLYTDLLRFQGDTTRHEMRLKDQNNATQRAIQNIAHALGLEYEYYLITREVRITRSQTERSGNLQGMTPMKEHPLEEPDVLSPLLSEAGLTGFDQWMGFAAADFPIFSDGMDLDFDCSTLLIDESYSQSERGLNFIDSQHFPACTISNQESTYRSSSALPAVYQCRYSDAGEYFSQPQKLVGQSYGNNAYVDWQDHDLVHDVADPESRTATPVCSPIFSQQGSSSSRPASFTSTNGSIRSTQGRNRVAKATKLFRQRSGSSLQPPEIVFDSNISRPASCSSSSPGRFKPLSDAARATMKAVRAIGGACWRCRFLRKACNPGTPCDMCPKHCKTSAWFSVGCKRNTFEEEMIPIFPCPAADPDHDLFHTRGGQARHIDMLMGPVFEVHAHANQRYWAHKLRQEEGVDELKNVSFIELAGQTAIPSSVHQGQVSGTLPIPSNQQTSNIRQARAPANVPLDDCILAISWELWNAKSEREADTPLEKLSIPKLLDLLVGAAAHQARQDSNSLIASAIYSLRTCLEAIKQESSPRTLHYRCTPTKCGITSIAAVKLSLSLHIKELSRVMFKKENMRNNSWWLSAFYSFCIASVVRKYLIELADGQSESYQPIARHAAKQYMILPLRLFLATSGSHDPLMRDFCINGQEPKEADGAQVLDLRAAQLAVQQACWATLGIKGSAGYLKFLFEDDGEPLKRTPPI